jgi:hypothetical protein
MAKSTAILDARLIIASLFAQAAAIKFLLDGMDWTAG